MLFEILFSGAFLAFCAWQLWDVRRAIRDRERREAEEREAQMSGERARHPEGE